MPESCPDPEAEAVQPGCSFYTNCLEPTYNCGPEGYPIGYGYKYCTSFYEHYEQFSPDGQKWIDGTCLCLKKALVPLVEDPKDYVCPAVQDYAFKTHVDCYIDNGFCELAFNYKHPFATAGFIKDLLSVYYIKDFFSFIA